MPQKWNRSADNVYITNKQTIITLSEQTNEHNLYIYSNIIRVFSRLNTSLLL